MHTISNEGEVAMESSIVYSLQPRLGLVPPSQPGEQP